MNSVALVSQIPIEPTQCVAQVPYSSKVTIQRMDQGSEPPGVFMQPVKTTRVTNPRRFVTLNFRYGRNMDGGNMGGLFAP